MTGSRVRAIRGVEGGPTSRAGDGLQVAVTRPAAVAADTGTATTTTLELTAVVIVALMFFIVYQVRRRHRPVAARPAEVVCAPCRAASM